MTQPKMWIHIPAPWFFLQILPQDDLPPFDTRRALEVIQEDLAAVKDPFLCFVDGK